VHRRIVIVAFAALVAPALLAACGEDDESVFNAEVGECIESLSDLTGQISELPEVDCDEPHEGEVIFLFEHDDADEFPGLAEVTTEAEEECEGDAFEDYIGVSFDETAILVQPITPTEETWDAGDRESVCVAHLLGEEVDESFEGNGEDYPLGSIGPGGGGGEPQDFSELIDECEGGDNAACDQLYFQTPVGSEEERIGATCGGRSDEALNGTCESVLG
jgi:hypothetical protein